MGRKDSPTITARFGGGSMSNKLLGSARFVWNQILAVSFEMLANNERINKVNLVNKIPELRKRTLRKFIRKHL